LSAKYIVAFHPCFVAFAGDKKSIALELPDTFHFEAEIDEIRMATAEEIAAGKPLIANDCGLGCSCQ
jgi:glycosyltransferase involved in cell wall biosynthesis